MMQQGKSDEEIKQYLVDRYSEFVLYDPPLETGTWLLWFGPLLILRGRSRRGSDGHPQTRRAVACRFRPMRRPTTGTTGEDRFFIAAAVMIAVALAALLAAAGTPGPSIGLARMACSRWPS
jgi:hypothetical protein